MHWLIENRGLHFALCGSSARKVKRGTANLLGGRAMRYELSGLTAGELGSEFDLDRMLNHGYLPRIYQASRPKRILEAYVSDYLKEEIAAEGLVRNLPVFSAFLDAAALSDGEVVNFSNVARDCGVSSHTTKSHFEILVDTLLGCWLPSYRKRPKRRVVAAPKFYFADIGVVNHLAKRGEVIAGSELYGKAFESWVFHELSAYRSYRDRDWDRGASGGHDVERPPQRAASALAGRAPGAPRGALGQDRSWRGNRSCFRLPRAGRCLVSRSRITSSASVRIASSRV
jgi:predicted AAA+ superfamily ATPase